MTLRRTPSVGGGGRKCVRLTDLDFIAAASRKPNVSFGSLRGDLVVVGSCQGDKTFAGEISSLRLNEGGGRGAAAGPRPAISPRLRFLFLFFYSF